jgi:hypothetical protein
VPRLTLSFWKQFGLVSGLSFLGAMVTSAGLLVVQSYVDFRCPGNEPCPVPTPLGALFGILLIGIGVSLMVIAVWLFTRWYPRASRDAGGSVR